MHGVRSVYTGIFFLVLISGFIFPAVIADQATNITESVTTTEPTITEIIQVVETTQPVEITAKTPVPTVNETVQPEKTITMTAIETIIPTATQMPAIPTITAEPSQAALNLPATTLVTTVTTAAAETTTPIQISTNGTCSGSVLAAEGTCTASSELYPVMHLTKEKQDEIYSTMDTAPKVSAMDRNLYYGTEYSGSLYSGPPLPGSKSLLSYITYTPAERNQGYCGDCWQWASTGAMEIEHAVRNNVKTRLSVQYINSNYNGGAAGSACCGGSLYGYTTWYNGDTAHRTPIPWANTNAGFGDLNRYCGVATAVSASSISTSPNYPLTSMTYSVISTTGVGQSTAVANIKSQINANKAVWYGFTDNTTGMGNFQSFFAYQNENQIYDPDPWANALWNGNDPEGHAVLIVGYNDTDPNPSNAYWVVLNSWGNPSGRPNGLFRLKMYMNYDSTYQDATSHWSGYPQHYFEIMNSNFNTPAQPAPTVTIINPLYGLNSSLVSITNLAGSNFYGIPTVVLNRTGYSDILATNVTVVDSTNITCTFPVTHIPAGQYNVTIINPDGQQAMLVNGFRVMMVSSSTIGLYQKSTGLFYLRNSNSGGNADNTFQFGNPGSEDIIPLEGDWTGTGKDTVGLYQKSTGLFYLRNSNSGGNADNTFQFGNPGSEDIIPLEGDWTGTGKDTVGLYQKSTGLFYLRNSNSGGNADNTFQFGNPGSEDIVPLVGDWTGTGKDTVGLYQKSTGLFYLRNSNSGGNADNTFQFGNPGSEDIVPLVGDWTGTGKDTVGLYQKSTGLFYLRNSNSGGNADNTFQFGSPSSTGDLVPLIGHWV
jgi:C1A family cysteine protease